MVVCNCDRNPTHLLLSGRHALPLPQNGFHDVNALHVLEVAILRSLSEIEAEASGRLFGKSLVSQQRHFLLAFQPRQFSSRRVGFLDLERSVGLDPRGVGFLVCSLVRLGGGRVFLRARSQYMRKPRDKVSRAKRTSNSDGDSALISPIARLKVSMMGVPG